MASENFQEIAVLIDNLRTSTEALKHLKRIATALGEARTREELIPFISEPQEDNDEHSLVLAQELGGLLGSVGGSPYGHVLLAPLETLTGSDENAVRDAAVQSIQIIVKDMTKAHVLEHVLPLLSRLTQGCYPQRVASCALCADVQQCVSSDEAVGIRSDFEQLTKDPLPVVRRAAAANLARQAQTAGDEHIDSLIQTFVQMAQDGHESIRRALVENSPAFAARCKSRPDAAKELLQNTIALMHDRSWRVRYCAATQVEHLAEAYGPEVTRSEIFPHYLNLLSDQDADVRGPACSALPAVCQHLDSSALTQMVRPKLLELAKDSSDLVRELLADHLIKLAPVLGKQQTIDLLLEPLLALLRDRTPEVRLNVLRSLPALAGVITLDQISEALLPTIDELAGDSTWRIRYQLVSLTPQLAKHFGMGFFQQQMVQRALAWLVDRTAVIRSAAAGIICEVAKEFGNEWTKGHLLEEVVKVTRNNNYLCRVSALYCMQDLCAALTPADTATYIVPACLAAAADRVPNTRFVAARVLQTIAPLVSQHAVQSQVVSTLKQMQQDPDPDVRFYASQSLYAYDDFSGGTMSS